MVRFCQRYLFAHSWESTNSGRSRSHLQNLPISTGPLTWIPWHRTTFLKEKKMEKRKKKRRIVVNGGRGRMELKKLKKKVWSTTTYSGEVPEEIRWKTGIWIHDGVRHNSIHGSWKHVCPRMSSAWSSRWWWKGMGTPMISQYGKFKLESG